MKPSSLIIWMVLLSWAIHSCHKDYLQKQPLGLLDDTALANQKGVEALLIGAYSMLDGIGGPKSGVHSAASNWIYGSICGSEAYKGSVEFDEVDNITPLERFTPTPSMSSLASKWSTVYAGVQRANDVLRLLAKAPDVSAADQSRITAEARFLRAHYHFEAKKMWNNIPFIDENVTYINRNYWVSNESDSWPAIEADLAYAVEHLPVEPFAGAVGRATRFTAMALLSKAFLFQKKWALAKPLLENIIQSGRFQLVNYADNFNPATKNSKESIFSVQMSVNDGAAGMNGNFGDILNFPVGGPGGCCGFFQPSQYLVNHFKTDANTGLPDLDHFNNSDVYNDEKVESNEQFVPYQGTLDSRLDWTVGRRGIPYLDWGIHPGSSWIRDQNYSGPYSPKKNVYYQYQQGKLTDATFWANTTTTNNVNLIRYADVLLWAAEVEIEIGSLDKGRAYINQIRARAAQPTSWVKKEDGSAAANYKVGLYNSPWASQEFARKALRYERMLELAMEGHRFFDLVRWGVAGTEINAYLQKEQLLRVYLQGAHFRIGTHEYFPIPQTQIDLSVTKEGKPTMKQNPGY